MKRSEYAGVWIDPVEVREWAISDELESMCDEYLDEVVAATEERYPLAEVVVCHPSQVATYAASGRLPTPYRETPLYDVVAGVTV